MVISSREWKPVFAKLRNRVTLIKQRLVNVCQSEASDEDSEVSTNLPINPDMLPAVHQQENPTDRGFAFDGGVRFSSSAAARLPRWE